MNGTQWRARYYVPSAGMDDMKRLKTWWVYLLLVYLLVYQVYRNIPRLVHKKQLVSRQSAGHSSADNIDSSGARSTSIRTFCRVLLVCFQKFSCSVQFCVVFCVPILWIFAVFGLYLTRPSRLMRWVIVIIILVYAECMV